MFKFDQKVQKMKETRHKYWTLYPVWVYWCEASIFVSDSSVLSRVWSYVFDSDVDVKIFKMESRVLLNVLESDWLVWSF